MACLVRQPCRRTAPLSAPPRGQSADLGILGPFAWDGSAEFTSSTNLQVKSALTARMNSSVRAKWPAANILGRNLFTKTKCAYIANAVPTSSDLLHLVHDSDI
ncbi:hypothetical protein SSIG_06110 [Streptomyces filamentosus NRRL 11379]|uniref:Predicted protein n=1 Tax=Streptomyces filamentosus NRRL 15998 TaxID=457431 RepID=D6ABP6_STRFL|nr:predicted protein [Streptomyces filamentosus NRRL 15998]EWS95377.1 hypothetical protein SSIG_06110 [Streptomyces filamentosus NRRL 11379]